MGSMKETHPYMVVPANEVEEAKAKVLGRSGAFYADMKTAQEVLERQNKYSGVLWRIKETEDEEIDWSIIEKDTK